MNATEFRVKNTRNKISKVKNTRNKISTAKQ
jgi:hypothetical protein